MNSNDSYLQQQKFKKSNRPPIHSIKADRIYNSRNSKSQIDNFALFLQHMQSTIVEIQKVKQTASLLLFTYSDLQQQKFKKSNRQSRRTVTLSLSTIVEIQKVKQTLMKKSCLCTMGSTIVEIQKVKQTKLPMGQVHWIYNSRNSKSQIDFMILQNGTRISTIVEIQKVKQTCLPQRFFHANLQQQKFKKSNRPKHAFCE